MSNETTNSNFERRSDHIPTAVLEFVERKFSETSKMLRDHVAIEEQELSAIRKSVADTQQQLALNRANHDSKHDLLMAEVKKITSSLESVHEQQTRCKANHEALEEVKTAFLKDDLERPDYHGHRGAHKSQRDAAGESAKILRHLLLVIAAAAAVSVSAWVWMSLKTAAIAEIQADQRQSAK